MKCQIDLRHRTYLSNGACKYILVAVTLLSQSAAGFGERDLIGHWKLQGDCRDHSGNDNHAINHGVMLQRGEFNGTSAYLEVPGSESLKLGSGDFTFSAWVHTEEQLDDIVGDVFDMYDPAARRGVTLSINSSAGGFQGHGSDRHVYFGIDNAKLSDWQDCGRPSESSNYVSESMTVYKGRLYAATTGGKEEKDWRRVYRYEGGQKWTDCGQVGDGHTQGVGPLIVHGGELYAATWTVDWTRISKGGYEPGRVYRYLGGTNWEDCGQPSDSRTLNCIASYKGKLYVGGGPETWGVFTQDNGKEWKPSIIFSKEGPRRCFPHSMAVFNDKLYTGYPVVYAFDGHKWTFAGQPIADDVNRLQLYCFIAHQGKLCVGSWPEAKVAVYENGENWREIGRVGEDGTEVNGLVVYNGKMYGGSLPRAEVCRYDGDSKWTSLKRFYSPEGWKPGIPYDSTREQVNEWVRLTSLTVYNGMLFASTGSCTSSVLDAPADVRGKVFCMEAGRCASFDSDLGSGWKHLVAMREGEHLKLFVNGKLVAQSRAFVPAEYDISTDQPLRIGFGQSDYFAGRMADVRMYNRALEADELQSLASQAPADAKSKSAQIILPRNPSRIERFAAIELQRCLNAALDWDVRIAGARAASQDGPDFYIRSADDIAELPAELQLEPSKASALEVDGVYLKANGKSVALLGKGARGGLNAVYEFLEKLVGYRWPEPGREYVPRRLSLPLTFEHVHNPAFLYRGVALHGPCTDEFHYQILDWLGKNRLNSVQFSCEVYDQLRPKILEAILDRGLSPKIGAHSRQYFYATDKYFPNSPKHFALVSGKRTGKTQLCYSNHESAAEYSKNVIEYLNARPEIGVVGLWPSDGYGFCECDQCKAAPTTDILLDYVNDVASRVHEHAPNVKVEFLSYIHYTTPPDKVAPLPYVIPTYCEYHSRSQYHPITDDRKGNANCRRQLERWAEVSDSATVYSYYADDIMKKFLYQPVADVVLSDLRYYKSVGLDGNSVLMMNPRSWWAHGPHMYAYAKGSWDLAAELKAVSVDYFQSLYGPAAASMKAHHDETKSLFSLKLHGGETGEQVLHSFRIKKFQPELEESETKHLNDTVRQMRNALQAASSETNDSWIAERIEILDQNAELMASIYGVLNEAAAYKLDKDERRKDRVREIMARVNVNKVVTDDDIRCSVVKSLMPHVNLVLGEEEAAKFDRVAIHPVE